MATRIDNPPDSEEGKIPVFTVLKNGAILKNIFIVNKPPEPLAFSDTNKYIASVRDYEDILLVGRHPDCNIVLTHPSISRFHLQIQSKPSSQKLSVTDLSSVHGTWISERKIEPGVTVELKEGDTLRIGGSSRVYRLHWIPISQAYDLENPFLSELDVATKEKGEKEAVADEENAEIVQNEKLCSEYNEEIQSLDSILECVSFLFYDENLELTLKKEIPSAPPLPEDVISFPSDEEWKSPCKDDYQERESVKFFSGPFDTEISNFRRTSKSGDKQCHKENHVLSSHHVQESIFQYYNPESSFSGLVKISDLSVSMETQSCVEVENEARPEAEKPKETEVSSTLREYLTESISLPVMEAVQGFNIRQSQDVADVPPDTVFSNILPGVQETSFPKRKPHLLTSLDPVSFDEKCVAALAEMSEETEFGCILRDNDSVEDILRTGAGDIINENTSFPVQEAFLDAKCQQVRIVKEVVMDPLSDGKQDKCFEEDKSKFQAYANAESCHEQGHSMDEIVQNIGNKCAGGICPILPPAESEDSSLLEEAHLEITDKKKNQTTQYLIAEAGCSEMKILESRVEAAEKNSPFRNIWSRRGKAASAPQIRTSKSRVKSTGNIDTESEMSNRKDIVNKKIFKDLTSVLDGEEEEEEYFTPDKENLSPNTLQLQFLKKHGKLEEIKDSRSQRSLNSKVNFSPITHPNESISPTSNKEKQTPKVTQEKKSQRLLKSKVNFSLIIHPNEILSPTSNKENQTPKVTQDKKSGRKPFGSQIKLEKEQDMMALKNTVERVPFESLIVNSEGKSRSETSGPVSAAEDISANNCGRILDNCIKSYQHISGELRRNWDMVVDTASLLNKESRKALQLLQGLKGTRLIIPRMVIRELDSMKRQFSVFRKTSEASSVLEWIEECMVRTKWWIHVQSLMEEESPIAPTPPASPPTQFSEENWTCPWGTGSLQPLSSHKSSLEIVTPTAEDQILDCALLYRRKKNGQLVLLSNDVSLKIKSMAEGLLCETAQQFRDSLVNPFSERFLWSKSSPRGLTWSCQDDMVLGDRYCGHPLRKSSKGDGARGLKLILLHNAHYGQISSAR